MKKPNKTISAIIKVLDTIKDLDFIMKSQKATIDATKEILREVQKELNKPTLAVNNIADALAKEISKRKSDG